MSNLVNRKVYSLEHHLCPNDESIQHIFFIQLQELQNKGSQFQNPGLQVGKNNNITNIHFSHSLIQFCDGLHQVQVQRRAKRSRELPRM